MRCLTKETSHNIAGKLTSLWKNSKLTFHGTKGRQCIGRVYYILILLIGVSLLAGCSPSEEDIMESIESASASAESGSPDEAVKTYRKSLQLIQRFSYGDTSDVTSVMFAELIISLDQSGLSREIVDELFTEVLESAMKQRCDHEKLSEHIISSDLPAEAKMRIAANHIDFIKTRIARKVVDRIRASFIESDLPKDAKVNFFCSDPEKLPEEDVRTFLIRVVSQPDVRAETKIECFQKMMEFFHYRWDIMGIAVSSDISQNAKTTLFQAVKNKVEAEGTFLDEEKMWAFAGWDLPIDEKINFFYIVMDDKTSLLRAWELFEVFSRMDVPQDTKIDLFHKMEASCLFSYFSNESEEVKDLLQHLIITQGPFLQDADKKRLFDEYNTYKPKESIQNPYIKGKVLTYDLTKMGDRVKDTNELEQEYSEALPERWKTGNSDEVGTIVFITEAENKKVGMYTSGGEAFQHCDNIMIIDKTTQTIIYKKIFCGPNPPETIQTESGIGGMFKGATGPRPVEEVMNFLKRLPVKG